MKRLFFTFCLLLSFYLQSQTFSSSLSDSFIIEYLDSAGNSVKSSPVLQNDYITEATKKETGYLEVKIKSSKENIAAETFSLKPLSIELFKSKFKLHYSKIIKASEGIAFSSEVFDEARISILFAQLISFERTEDERPVVANISLNDNIPIIIPYYEEKRNNDGSIFFEFKHEIVEVDDVKLELTFYNGFIEKVELETEVKEVPVRFTNLFSIGISSLDGIKKFTNHKLQSFYKYTYDKANDELKKDRYTDDVIGQFLEINFSDIIDYDREIDINANDISPEPTKLVLDGVQKSTKLYRPESTKLFEAIVYSDFFGVFDEDNPNGIIQTEVSKKFYINTKRKQLNGRNWNWLWFILPTSWYSDAIGLGEYINLNARLTKIEENNKFLEPIQVGDDNFFSPLRIKQHESFSIGGDVNALFFESQNRKINSILDFGWNYGRSAIELSEQNQFFLNTITASATMSFHVIPEKRYGFVASNRISHFFILNDDLINNEENFSIMSLEDGELASPNNWLNTTQVEFYVNTSVTGKLFIRYNLTTELNDWDNNFSQFQFGYSFFILRQNGKIK